MESSVGVQVDNVWSSWVGSTWANYTDIDHVEVLRGPQGTLQGKNSNLGLLNVVTKLPSFTPGYTVDGFAGNRDSLQGKVSATGPIFPGLLAYRASLYVDRRDGYITNFDSPTTVGKIGETNALGGRLQFLWTPTDTLSGRFIVDRSSSTQTMSANPLLADPLTFADGTARTTSFSSRLARSWFDVYRLNGRKLSVIGDPRGYAQNDKQVSRGDQQGVSGEFNWDVLGHRFTSISAYRYSLFEPHHDGDNSIASIQQIGGVTVRNRQWSQEFRISSKEPGPVDYQVGVFAMHNNAETLSQNLYGADAGAFYANNGQYNTLNATPAGRELLRQSLNGVLRQQFLKPETTSLAGFGQMNWHITDAATLTLGLRHTWEHRDNQGWTDNFGGVPVTGTALAIRRNVVGSSWVAPRQGFSQTSQNWLVNPSYKFTDSLMAYFSVSGGQKSGAAQFNTNTGKPQNVDPEDILDFELGVKSQWFNRKLTANLNLYETNIKGFQSQLTNTCVAGSPGCPSGFITLLGNVNGIQLRGIELETNWTAIDGLNLFLNGSYNHAIYTDFKNAPCPAETANVRPQCDQTGLTIPNAPAFTVNYGVDYKVPFGLGHWDDHGLVWHAYLVDSYKSSANYNSSLSSVGKQAAYHVTDGGIGIATKNGQYSLDLVGRNIFDTIYVTNVGSWSGTGAASATYGDARYYGAHFRANF
jgi:iron complex outermembrane receptor protein